MAERSSDEFAEELVRQYIQLGRALLDAGGIQAALECAITARSHTGDDPEVNELFRDAAELLEPQAIVAPTSDTNELLARKRRLDQAWETRRGVWMDRPAPEPGDGPGGGIVDEELASDIRQSLARLRTGDADIDPEIVDYLERICERIGVELEYEPPEQMIFTDLMAVEHHLHKIGNEMYRLGHFDEAVRFYDAALHIQPEMLETLFNRALAHTRLESYARAQADLLKVIDLNPDLAESHYTLGLVYEYMHQWDDAIACYEKALEVDSDYNRARQQLEVARGKKAAEDADDTTSTSSSRHEGHEITNFSEYIEHPVCGLDEVGGCEDAKAEVRRIIAWTQPENRSIFESWGAELSGGILLWGRPGVGKTLLARAVAGEIRCPFFAVPAGEMVSMWAGETERTLTNLWREAAKHDTAVIYIPEIDSLAARRTDTRHPQGSHWRNRIVGCLLDLMEGLHGRQDGTVVIADSNLVHNVDPALLRSGRFTPIEVTPPSNLREWAEVWLIHLEKADQRATRTDLLEPGLREALLADRAQWLDEHCARATGGHPIVRLARSSMQRQFVPADVAGIVRNALSERAMTLVEPPRLNLGPISFMDFSRHLDGYDPFQPDRDGPESDSAPPPISWA